MNHATTRVVRARPKVIRMPATNRERLSHRWLAAAGDIFAAVRQQQEADGREKAAALVEESIRRYGVGTVRLQRDSFVMHIEALGNDEGREILEGWLCFDDEINAIHYLDHVWFRYAKSLHRDADETMKELIQIVERAVSLARREGGFKYPVVKDVILESIHQLTSVAILSALYLHDKDLEIELACDVADAEANRELLHLAESRSLNVNLPQHLRLMEAWMSQPRHCSP